MLTKSKTKPTLKPRALRPGDKVGLVCPGSRPLTPAVVARSERLVRELGLEPVLGKHVLDTHGYMAGEDNERLADLHRFISDESIAGIFCITGGFGSLHLLPYLDYAAIADKRKLLIGCDDNTCLLNAIYARTGLVSFHGPNLEQIKSRNTFERFKTAVMSNSTLAPLSAFEHDSDVVAAAADFYCSVEGTAQGKLIGGNLTALASLLGTEYMPEPRDTIIFLEDINEQNGILDRWFTSLYLSGALQYANAIVCGSFENCTGREQNNMLSVMDTFGDRLQYLRKTSCFGMPFGQKQDTAVVPVGIQARLDAASGRLEFLEPALL